MQESTCTFLYINLVPFTVGQIKFPNIHIRPFNKGQQQVLYPLLQEKVPPVNSEVLAQLKNIESPVHMQVSVNTSIMCPSLWDKIPIPLPIYIAGKHMYTNHTNINSQTIQRDIKCNLTVSGTVKKLQEFHFLVQAIFKALSVYISNNFQDLYIYYMYKLQMQVQTD